MKIKNKFNFYLRLEIYLFVLGVVVLSSIFIINQYYHYPEIFEPAKDFYTDIQKKSKCEDSGGKWYDGCSSQYGSCWMCSCVIGNKIIALGDDTWEVLKNGECVPCKVDSDCGNNKCSQGRNGCTEYNYNCKEGICSRDVEEYGSYKGPKTHECVDTECVSCGNDCVTK